MTKYEPHPFYNPGETVDEFLSRLGKDTTQFNKRAFPIPGSQKSGYSPIYRNQISKEKLNHVMHPKLTTLYEAIMYGLSKAPETPFLMKREDFSSPWIAISRGEAKEISTKLGSGLKYMLKSAGSAESAIVSFYLPNCVEIVLAEFATQFYSLTNTGLYNTLGAEAIVYSLRKTESPILITNKSKVDVLLSLKAEHDLSTLKIFIVVEPLNAAEDFDLFQKALKTGTSLYSWDTVLKIGTDHLLPHIPPDPEDAFTIAFTSGSTSLPKGAVLKHVNMVSAIAGNMASMTYLHDVPQSRKKEFAFLPMVHVFEKLAFFLEVYFGMTYYMPTNPYNVLDYFTDIKDVQPLTLVTVPRVLNRIQMLLSTKIQASAYMNKIVQDKISRMESGERFPSHFIFDRFIRPKIKKALGFQNLVMFFSGGAPISRSTLLFLEAVLGIPIFHGYGLTETSSTVSLTTESIAEMGTSGTINTAIEVKLKDVPDLGYEYTKNKTGELLVRGNPVISTYYKDQAKFDDTCEDGWFRTGDIAKINDYGSIEIVDRIKNFFKLSQGKFIAVEKIENAYESKNLLIEQIFIYGDGLKDFLVAIIGLNVSELQSLSSQIGIKFAHYSKIQSAINSNDLESVKNEISQLCDIVNRPETKTELLARLTAPVDGLVAFEYVKNVHFDISPFTVANGTLTGTLKIQRPKAKKLYGEIIEKLYKEGPILKANSNKL